MEPATTQTPARPGRAKWIAGCSLIVIGIGVLAFWAMSSPGALAYYTTPAELKAEGTADGATVRLGGRVAPGTLERDGTFVAFTVTDGEEAVPVVFTGEVPDTLQEETDVIAEGALGPDGTLVATRVLAKCSSKFVPADKADEHLGRTASG